MQLDPIARDAGVQLEALGTVGSTNEEARNRSRQGVPAPLWITAVAQTRGRGRMGRSWVSPQGNLYASLLLYDPSPFECAPQLALVSALALRDAIVAEAPALSAKLAFKWPNDLLLADAKCAGILIEGEVERKPLEQPAGPSVVIGIGANCTSHPRAPMPGDVTVAGRDHILYPATDLRSQGAALTPPQLFRRLSATMQRRLAQWKRGEGFSAILADWLAAARGLGEEITVHDLGSEKHGRFVGLDQSGRLILERPGGGLETISAGDVFPFAVRDMPAVYGSAG
jgi:BirA family biotin operon repressor/biotin-[acetyl-CoA-carboxylase] ligase